MFLVKSTFMDATYSEIYENTDVLIYRELKNRFLNQIRNIHTSIKLNQYFTIPFQSVWKHTFFDEKKLAKDEECIFLFEEGNKQAYNKAYLTYIRYKYKKAKLCFLFWNPSNYLKSKYIDFVNNTYDLIISFDTQDCKKYGWVHYSGIYSKPNNYVSNNNPKYDIFFVGHNKGRLEKLRALYNRFIENGLNCDFYISKVQQDECLQDGIHYNEYLSYEDVIKHIQNSKAILEVLQEGQHGSTLRPMEALVYERLLLTNNKEVKDERYYYDKQFYIFDDIEKIDIREIAELCESNDTFTYKGNLSPRIFLKFLEERY